MRAHGEIDKWESSAIAMFLIGYGNDYQGYFVEAGFSKFMVVYIDNFFVFTWRFIKTAGKLNLEINILLANSLSFSIRLS